MPSPLDLEDMKRLATRIETQITIYLEETQALTQEIDALVLNEYNETTYEKALAKGEALRNEVESFFNTSKTTLGRSHIDFSAIIEPAKEKLNEFGKMMTAWEKKKKARLVGLKEAPPLTTEQQEAEREQRKGLEKRR